MIKYSCKILVLMLVLCFSVGVAIAEMGDGDVLEAETDKAMYVQGDNVYVSLVYKNATPNTSSNYGRDYFWSGTFDGVVALSSYPNNAIPWQDTFTFVNECWGDGTSDLYINGNSSQVIGFYKIPRRVTKRLKPGMYVVQCSFLVMDSSGIPEFVLRAEKLIVIKKRLRYRSQVIKESGFNNQQK